MLQNAYFLAKIGADTAENEQHFAEICQKLATTLRVHYPTGPPERRQGGALRDRLRGGRLQRAARLHRGRRASGGGPPGLGLAKLGKLAKFREFWAGSFSAVSKRNFPGKYAFDTFFNLYKICTLLHRCNLKILAKIGLKNQHFS